MATKKTRQLTAKPLGDVDKQNRIDLKTKADTATPPAPISGRLSESAINLISFSVQERNHDPEEVRQLLSDFVFYVETDRPVPRNLLRHLGGGISSYLQNPKDGGLERAIGTRRKNKRPSISEQRDKAIAHEVLCQLLGGALNEGAHAAVGEKHHRSVSAIKKIWLAHRDHALLVERLARDRAAKDGKGLWSEDEIARIDKIWKRQ